MSIRICAHTLYLRAHRHAHTRSNTHAKYAHGVRAIVHIFVIELCELGVDKLSGSYHDDITRSEFHIGPTGKGLAMIEQALWDIAFATVLAFVGFAAIAVFCI